MSESVLKRLEALFPTLGQAVFLLDRQGRCLVPRQPDTFILPANLKPGVPVSKAGYLFLALPGFEALALATKDRPEARDILLLSSSLIEAINRDQGITRELGNALKRLALGELSGLELESLVSEYRVDNHCSRRALMIHLADSRRRVPGVSLDEYVPKGEQDFLVTLDSRNLVLARGISEEDLEDTRDYALALLDTLQNELGLTARIGISAAFDDLLGLAAACSQARQAIEIGVVFSPESPIHAYERLVLERLITDCFPQQAKLYSEGLFNADNSKLFNGEMLETVNAFLKHDLNLTDAAKALYIHRNTLVYRLDKIQKACGLDLRHFYDAMLFKLLNDFRKREAASAPGPAMKNERQTL